MLPDHPKHRPVTLDDIDRAGRGIPLPADVQPAAAHLTEDFYRAGGLDAVLGQIAEHLEAGLTVSGCRLTDQISGELPRDARMSGTAFGRPARRPESAAGGPLALVRTGDLIELDVPGRRLHLDVPAEELAGRTPVTAAAPPAASGWEQL